MRVKSDNTQAIKYRVTKGAEDHNHYHLSEWRKYVSLCGTRVVHSGGIPVSAWGEMTEVGERWCVDCRAKAGI